RSRSMDSARDLVDAPSRHAESRGHLSGCVACARTARHRRAACVLDRRVVDRSTLALRRRPDDENVLAAHDTTLAVIPRSCCSERAAPHLFVHLRELARDDDRPIVAARVTQVVDRAHDTVRRLEADHRTALDRDLRQAGGTLASATWQETLEHEAI